MFYKNTLVKNQIQFLKASYLQCQKIWFLEAHFLE